MWSTSQETILPLEHNLLEEESERSQALSKLAAHRAVLQQQWHHLAEIVDEFTERYCKAVAPLLPEPVQIPVSLTSGILNDKASKQMLLRRWFAHLAKITHPDTAVHQEPQKDFPAIHSAYRTGDSRALLALYQKWEGTKECQLLEEQPVEMRDTYYLARTQLLEEEIRAWETRLDTIYQSDAYALFKRAQEAEEQGIDFIAYMCDYLNSTALSD